MRSIVILAGATLVLLLWYQVAFATIPHED